MKHRATMLSIVALTTAAGAQPPSTTGSTVTYSLSFVEIGGNTNGTLEPGESALIQVSVSFSNQNTTATYAPLQPPPGSGTIRGFGSGFIDLIGAANNGGNADGAWNVDFVSPGSGPVPDPWYSSLAGWGTPANGGSILRNIQFGQFPISATQIITRNPVSLIYQALWTPASYAPRTVSFASAPALLSGGFESSVMLRIEGPQTVAGACCPSDLGSISIPIIPAPAATPLLLAPLLARRRRYSGLSP